VGHRQLIAVLVWAAVLFGLRLNLPLLEPEETRYAEIPRQMLAEDRFLVPVFDHQTYLDKPPLLYWLVMASYHIFGVHVWSARLVTILTAWLTIGVVYLWGRRIGGETTGLVAALLLTLFGDFVYRAPMLTMNGPLALFVAIGLAAGHVAMMGSVLDRRWWTLSAVAVAAGITMKGPVAIVLVAGPLFAIPWLDRRLIRPGLLAWIVYGGVVAALAGPWFVCVALREPGFVEYFFLKHHVERFTSPFDHAQPVWYYLPLFLAGVFPWSFALLLGFRRMMRSPVTRLLLVAGFGGLVFFSLAGSKRPVYLVPIYPPLALALAVAYAKEALMPASARIFVTASACVVGAALLLGTLFWLPGYSERHSSRPSVAALRE
jgi:4-amino-4-deoxy-L-arabinose transferase-like glycosyltransferase